MISLAEACAFKESSTVKLLQNKSSMIGVTDKRMPRFPSFIIIEYTLTRTIKRYLTGFAGLVVVENPSKLQPITESSGSVLNFDLWE